MSNYDNNNRGAIWINDKKVKDTQPDFTGSVRVDNKDYFFSGWNRKPDAGPRSPEMSISFTPKEQYSQQSAPATKKAPAASNDFDNDGDIPF